MGSQTHLHVGGRDNAWQGAMLQEPIGRETIMGNLIPQWRNGLYGWQLML